MHTPLKCHALTSAIWGKQIQAHLNKPSFRESGKSYLKAAFRKSEALDSEYIRGDGFYRPEGQLPTV